MGLAFKTSGPAARCGHKLKQVAFGVNPVVPGQLIGEPGVPMPVDHLKGLVKHLEAAADEPFKPMSNHNTNPKKTYMPDETLSATHVYIKKENPKGLLQSYSGPHPIVDRPSQSTVRVKVGTFKTGVDNVQLHHWANLKPARLREDAVEGQMPVRGRPPKASPDPTSQVGSQNNTDQTKTNSNDADESKQTDDANNAPSDHETSSPPDRVPHPQTANDAFNGLLTGPPTAPAFGRPRRSTRNQNPQYIDGFTSSVVLYN